jgi:hypothetical protein
MFMGLLAGLLMATSPQQDPPPDPNSARLDDVVVEGRRLEQLAREFISDVAAPTRQRGLARWNTRLCVGVAGLRRDLAQNIIDRISDVAGELGVAVGDPGCKPNALIVAAEDGSSFATAMVSARRRAFDVGSLQITQNDRALENFMSADRPVRWWQVSVPTDSTTGRRAIRLAGDDAPPVISVFAASRVVSQIRDDMSKVVVIMDMDDITGLTSAQLSDYLAMVVLAQIDADADSSSYNTVLNLFDDPAGVEGLTEWDRAYLRGLYEAEQNRINTGSQARNVADAVVRARREAATGVSAQAEDR